MIEIVFVRKMNGGVVANPPHTMVEQADDLPAVGMYSRVFDCLQLL